MLDTKLFDVDSRSTALNALYDSANKTPVKTMRQLDRWRRDGRRSSRFFMCTPVLGARRRKVKNVDIDIETRVPTAVEELRRWTSTEALGDITVTPDCTNRISSNVTVAADGDATDGTLLSDDEGIDHKLPSPEEQLQVVALKFPSEMVAVDISGKSFNRMCLMRRSMVHGDVNCTVDGDTVKRRTRTRRPRGKRRNTLAGTDEKEIQDAITAGDQPSSSAEIDTVLGNVIRSKSSDLLRSSTKKESTEVKRSHFNSLKQWGKNRYDKLMNKSNEGKSEQSDDIDEFNLYETVASRRRRNIDKRIHQRSSSVSSSEKSSVNMPFSTLSGVMNIAVKLRESSLQRRERRSGANKDEPHSSSGNWSASSESGRNSIGSEITSTTLPKSTTSAATSNNSLNQPAPNSVNSRRRFNVNASTSSSITSEGTLTPDIIHDLHEDGETSSVYSCDTEGYYTSFHMDSGLKTLKEEDLPMTPLHSTSTFTNSSSNTAENEYELFGKGSTSTTTSSAGTVCTTLKAGDSRRSLIVGPAVPERKSSLSKLSDRKHSPESSLERDYGSDKTGTVKRSPATSKAHNMSSKRVDGDVSPDSGHNTSSSPIESINSPNGMRSGSEFEFSESSDMEGSERIERIRVKTTINSSRIPSMCVITPSQSDDESSQSSHNSNKLSTPTTIGFRNSTRPTNLELENPIQTDTGKISYYASKDYLKTSARIVKTLISGTNKVQVINVDQQSGYATVETLESGGRKEKPKITCTDINQNTSSIPINKSAIRAPSPSGGTVIIKEEFPKAKTAQPVIKASLLPLNSMFGKLKTNLANFAYKRDSSKSPSRITSGEEVSQEMGEYVTITDVNNMKNAALTDDTTYANDIVNKNLKTVLSGKIRETEYISLNELPCNETANNVSNLNNNDSLERTKRHGARVTLDAEGKVVYSSDSLKRRKGSHSTFEPGPFVKPSNTPTHSPMPVHRTPVAVRPVAVTTEPKSADLNNSTPQLGKVVIKASTGTSVPTSEVVRMPPSLIVTPNMRPMSPKAVGRGAYVHVQDAERSLSPTQEKDRVPSPNNYSMHQCAPHVSSPTMQPYMSNDMSIYRDAIYEIDSDQYAGPGHQYYHTRNTHMYHTLPTKKTSYLTDVNSERSVTPDITRGLERRHNLDTMLTGNYDNAQYAYHETYSKNVHDDSSFLNQNLGIPLGVPQGNYDYSTQETFRNTDQFSLSRSNYTHKAQANLPSAYTDSYGYAQTIPDDSIRISPIDPRNLGGFHSSTPSQKNTSQPLKAAMNLENKLMSPKKSTMSNEELYAVIHKSKKKMNIATVDPNSSFPVPQDEVDEVSRIQRVKSPESGYLGDKSQSRLSWSPTKGEYVDFNQDIDKISPPNDSRSRQSWACNDRKSGQSTSRLDFKKLLLLKSNNILSKPSKKMSAVEQLKLSKQQQAEPKSMPPEMSILELSGSPRSLVNRRFMQNAPGSPKNSEKSKPIPKLLSPRSQWRFASPRTDVLSSTILEDCREDESANSSGEKRTSPAPSPIRLENKFNECINPSPTTNSTNAFNNYSVSQTKTGPEHTSIPKYTSISERIQAQRANFFNTKTAVQNKPVNQNPLRQDVKPSIQTLETDF